MKEEVDEPPLAIFFSEFDNAQGRKITFQCPKNFISNKDFESISKYMITPEEFCGRVITLSASDYQIMGYPMCFEGAKYDRLSYLCNISFVFRAESCSSPYRAVLKTLGSTLEDLEQEEAFLSLASLPGTTHKLEELLTHAWKELKKNGYCVRQINKANALSLRVSSPLPLTPSVEAYEVPVLLTNWSDQSCSSEADLMMKRVIPYIDGINHADKIAQLARVDVYFCCETIRQLLHFRFAALVDIFQYSNVYLNTGKINELVDDAKFQDKCLAYVTCLVLETTPMQQRHALLTLILSLYGAMRPGVTIEDILLKESNKASSHLLGYIDERRLCVFGVIYGIITRMHAYPTLTRKETNDGVKLETKQRRGTEKGGVESQLGRHSGRPIRHCLDGDTCSDEICVEFGISFKKLKESLKNFPGHVIMYR